jgi:vacuolar-type H+-ATPase subunit E/Vma4
LKGEKVEVRADKATQKVLTSAVLDELAKSTGSQLTLGQPLEQGTGVVLTAAGGHLNFDNTLETRLSRLQSGMRPAIFQILMGETA